MPAPTASTRAMRVLNLLDKVSRNEYRVSHSGVVDQTMRVIRRHMQDYTLAISGMWLIARCVSKKAGAARVRRFMKTLSRVFETHRMHRSMRAAMVSIVCRISPRFPQVAIRFRSFLYELIDEAAHPLTFSPMQTSRAIEALCAAVLHMTTRQALSVVTRVATTVAHSTNDQVIHSALSFIKVLVDDDATALLVASDALFVVWDKFRRVSFGIEVDRHAYMLLRTASFEPLLGDDSVVSSLLKRGGGCVICMEGETLDAHVLQCGHSFCRECIIQHVSTCIVGHGGACASCAEATMPTCPLCRCSLHASDIFIARPVA